MKLRHIYFALLIVCLVISVGGCANRNARSAASYTSTPHLYPATRYALRGEVAQHWVDRVPPSQSSGYWLFPSDFMKVMVMELLAGTTGYVYSIVVEVPVSLAVDTVLIPMDDTRVRAFNRQNEHFHQALLGDAWPVAPETLQRYYQPGLADEYVRELVAQPVSPETRAKLKALTEAGIGLPDLATSPAMDDALGTLLVEGARLPGQITLFVYYNLARNPASPAATLLAVAETEGSWILSVHRELARNPRATPAVLVALLNAPEGKELGYSMPERSALLWEAARHPAHTADSLRRYTQAGNATLSLIVARHPGADETVLETVLEQAIEWRSVYTAEPVSTHPNTTASLLHRLSLGLIEPMLEEGEDTLNSYDLSVLSGLLHNVSIHPSADQRALDEVLRLTARLSGLVGPESQRTQAQIEQTRLEARERLGIKSEMPSRP